LGYAGRMTDTRAILIAGPTASGKSALALRLAEATGGSVVNADSMQVYRELRVLTARPSPADEARAPHLLYGHVTAAEAYSAGRYARDAAQVIARVRAAGRRPIVVGGTGLYFHALLQGLSPVPEIPPGVRASWRARAASLDPAALHALLAERDAVMAARLRPTDPQRVTRALEVLDATGHSLAHWQALPGAPVLHDADIAVRAVMMPARDDLYRRCDDRFAAMMGNGAETEVAALAALGLDPGLPAMRALGVAPLLQLANDQITRDAATAAACAQTRQYAKRQATWLRSNMQSWKWFHAQEIERLAPEILQLISV
jgi:tRNA dimethylallyltransferase